MDYKLLYALKSGKNIKLVYYIKVSSINSIYPLVSDSRTL